MAKLPVVEALRDHSRAVLVAIGAKMVETAPFYIFAIFAVSYATDSLGYGRGEALNAVSVGALVACVMIPVMGRLADTVGPRPVFLGGALLSGLLIFPYFMLVNVQWTWALVAGTVLGMGVLWPPVTATLGTLTSEIFTTRVRYTGITLGYQVGAALAGGTAPLLATYLLATVDEQWLQIAVYIAVMAAISITAVSLAGRVAVNEDEHTAAVEGSPA